MTGSLQTFYKDINKPFVTQIATILKNLKAVSESKFRVYRESIQKKTLLNMFYRPV
jgi:hypothetical protein